MKKFALPLIIVVAIGVLIAIFALGNNSSKSDNASPSPGAKAIADPKSLPGLLTTTTPWNENTGQLSQRLDAIGLPKLSAEGTALHIHQHIDLFINGQAVAIPADIGISTSQNFIATIHVHDKSGIIHVESPTVQAFYLGQFFDIWGVNFTQNCIGSYCAGSGNTLTVYVNGTKYSGDPRQLKLAAHQEIAIVYGSAGATPSPLPSSYPFASGL